MARFFPVLKRKQRWIKPYHHGAPATSQIATAGRVYLAEFEVQTTVTVDQIAWSNLATVAGNLRVGIYGPLVTEETCAGAALIYDSGDIVMSGINTAQAHTFSANKTLTPGRYYLALQSDSSTATFARDNQLVLVTGWGQTYDRSGGYGAFTNPCPAVASSSAVIGLRLRCVV
jgi:hypothetical protein